MTTLALKLTLTPILIGLASLAGRRWGPAISGWLVGLPLTSGPVIFLLALAQGPAFAGDAARGTLAGTLSECGFCLAFGWLAWRVGWFWAILGGSVAFLACAFALQWLALAPLALLLLIVAALLLTLRLLPACRPRRRGEVSAPPDESPASRLPRWDLPARMTLATAFVVLLTSLAPALGPRLTGLIAPFPVFVTILAVFALRQSGPAAATGVLHGLLLGLFFAVFFFVLALLLAPLGVALSFAGALICALATQGVTLWLMRRGARASVSSGVSSHRR